MLNSLIKYNVFDVIFIYTHIVKKPIEEKRGIVNVLIVKELEHLVNDTQIKLIFVAVFKLKQNINNNGNTIRMVL